MSSRSQNADHSPRSPHAGDTTLVDEDYTPDYFKDADKIDEHTWIPARHAQRTIVLCFDGTGDEFDSDNSNVVQLVSMLKKDATSQQLVYYQTGVGTDIQSSVPLYSYVSSTLDEMFATRLGIHIKEGYTFLMQNYTYGDKVCIFGFSRGAYTARALAGMLQKVGLLPVHNHQQVPFAYEMYKREDVEGLELSELFKRTFCRRVYVDFLGVWDTVASVGAIPRYLPFVNENNAVRYFRHALSLDERRIKFLPSYCVDTRKASNNNTPRSPGRIFEDTLNQQERATNTKEVWFAGVHCDIGGGSVKNDTPHALSRIPLRWMIRESFRCNTGMIFDAVMLQQIGLHVRVNPKTGEAVLGEVPERIPASAHSRDTSSDASQSKKGELAFLLALLKSLSYHFTKLVSIFRPPSRAKHVRRGRQVIPARHQAADADEHTLQANLPDDYEAAEELKDALSPLYDQLDANWIWRVMEYFPLRVKKQKAIVDEAIGNEGFQWVVNRGRGRKIYKFEMNEGMKVHRSVKTRLEAARILEELYVPKVRPHIHSMGKRKGEPEVLPHHVWNVETPEHWEWVE